MPLPDELNAEKLRAKVGLRILPLIFMIYVVAYLDRANVAFAKAALSEDLHFSEAVFGLGAGIFYIGYLALEIPGALLVERGSARRMMARIMITWGFCSALTGFVQTPFQFYLVRFVLGIAEAGFFPGIIVFLTHWFPSRERARALAGLIMAIPFSMTLGAPISAKLLELDWLGMNGWRWMFILEGIPSIILGFIVYRHLTDRPRDAKWLTAVEKDWLETRLQEDSEKNAVSKEISLWQGLKHPDVLKLAFALFFSNIGTTTIIFWLPTLIKKALETSGVTSLLWSTLPFAVGMIALRLLGWASDRSGERKWHCILTQIAAAGFLMLSTAPGNSFGWSMFCLCMTAAGVFAWPAPFWVLPTQTLTRSAAAGSIGLINSFGSLAGFVGPVFIGFLLSHNFTMHQSFVFLSVTYAFSAALILSVRIKRDAEIPPVPLPAPTPATPP